MSKKERVLSWILLVLCAAPILTAVVGVQFLPDGRVDMKACGWFGEDEE